MAYTQAQWLAKLKKFVPSWHFEDPSGLDELIFLGIAGVMQQIQQDADDCVAATFLTKAKTPNLDLEGFERNKIRNVDEEDPSYVARIQQITSKTDYANIEAAVNAILINGTCVIYDAISGSPYTNNGTFADCDYYISDFPYGQYFCMVILPQNPLTLSFADFNYADWDYVGGTDESSPLYAQIIALINSMRAGGEVYQVVVSTHSAI